VKEDHIAALQQEFAAIPWNIKLHCSNGIPHREDCTRSGPNCHVLLDDRVQAIDKVGRYPE